MVSRFCRSLKFVLPIKSIIIVIIVTFVILLPIICWNLQYSSYFIEGDLNYAAYLKRVDNNKRIAEARSYLGIKSKRQSLPFSYFNLSRNKKPEVQKIYPRIAVVILAKNRDTHKVDAYEPKYLTQNVHALLKSIDFETDNHGFRWKNITLLMCNVDEWPEKFFELKQLSKYIEYVVINQSLNVMSNKYCDAHSHMMSCIDSGLKKYKDYNQFIIVEDDLLAGKNFFQVLVNIFDSLNKRFKKNMSKLAFVQLYYPKNEMKYSFWDSNSWLELLIISWSLVFLLFLLYFRFHMKSFFILYNILLLIVLFLICMAAVIAIGRPHWRSAYHRFTKNYALVESFSKSTSALLMDRLYMNDLVTEFDLKSSCDDNEVKFDFMEKVAAKDNRRILSINNNVFKHVGLYSHFKTTIINPHHID